MASKKKSGPGKDYESWEDLANKIDWEGGMCEYFVSYESQEGWTDPELTRLHKNLVDAAEAMRAYLEPKGALL